MDPAMLKGQ
jgi:hypothetical protein